MQTRKAMVWWLVNDANPHPALTTDEQKIAGIMPLVSAMFPGINYFSITGFSALMQQCVQPMLKKQHAELIGVAANDISADDMIEVAEVMPSDGYEWQNSREWRSRFDELLKAA